MDHEYDAPTFMRRENIADSDRRWVFGAYGRYALPMHSAGTRHPEPRSTLSGPDRERLAHVLTEGTVAQLVSVRKRYGLGPGDQRPFYTLDWVDAVASQVRLLAYDERLPDLDGRLLAYAAAWHADQPGDPGESADAAAAALVARFPAISEEEVESKVKRPILGLVLDDQGRFRGVNHQNVHQAALADAVAKLWAEPAGAFAWLREGLDRWLFGGSGSHGPDPTESYVRAHLERGVRALGRHRFLLSASQRGGSNQMAATVKRLRAMLEAYEQQPVPYSDLLRLARPWS